jgi:hypothetical protein
MVSDVLFEALDQIGSYLDEPRMYVGEQRDMIFALCDHMRAVMRSLDRPPLEQVANITQRNETGK